ncbi:MAG: T9SS type A sorting domain-containing protein [Saprospirales bacterium]|nr:T9SS type A sorting domain-containing protein [Saprospirales bacterium]
MAEVCDGLDNNCNGVADDGLLTFIYFADNDGDGFGAAGMLLSCLTTPPAGFTADSTDCDDANMAVYPGAAEVPDSLDNDCNGLVDDIVGTSTAAANGIRVFPNPARHAVTIVNNNPEPVRVELYQTSGHLVMSGLLAFSSQQEVLDLSRWAPGVYVLKIHPENGGWARVLRLVKIE